MISGGIGGANTTTGLRFEKKTDLSAAFKKSNIDVSMVSFYSKNSFIRWAEQRLGYSVDKIWSKRLFPDDVAIIGKHIYVIEKKYQQTNGSVDEKPQTAPFKKWQYKKLADALGMEVSYCYLFNDWFRNEKYKDMLDFIELSDCSYFFNEIPLSYFSELNV